MTWPTFFTDPAMTLLLIGGVLVLLVFMYWQKDDSEFDLRDLFIDTKTRRLNPEKFGVMTALAMSSWGFISQIQDGKMTEWYFGGYMAAWGALRVATKWAGSKTPTEPKP